MGWKSLPSWWHNRLGERGRGRAVRPSRSRGRNGGGPETMRRLLPVLAIGGGMLVLLCQSGSVAAPGGYTLQEYPVPGGSHPHDVAPAADGGIWYTAQTAGELGHLDPATRKTRHIKLGEGSAPHGVIVGPDGAPWITDGGLNAIVRVDPKTSSVQRYPLPSEAGWANLNTATFDRRGLLWFTGQSGVYGRLDPKTGKVDVFDAPRGRGPYGMCTTPDGSVYYASLAGSYIARINLAGGGVTGLEPPAARQGARRVWADSRGRLWGSEWDAGQIAPDDPGTGRWRGGRPPGSHAMGHGGVGDGRGMGWGGDWGG